MRARAVRRTHPGASRTRILHRRRPREVTRPCAERPLPCDATFVALTVLDMCDAHAREERIDRLVESIVTGLQAHDALAR